MQDLDALSKDTYQNSWAFTSTDVADDKTSAINEALSGFYNAVGGWLSGCIDRAHVQVRYYDITAHGDGSPHGGPIRTMPLVITTAVTGGQPALPNQCAACIHLQTTHDSAFVTAGPIPTQDWAQDQGAPATHPGSRRPREQMSGRIYLGPLTAGVLAQTDPTRATVAPAFRTAVANALRALITELGGAVVWAIWSRVSSQLGSVDSARVEDILNTIRGRVVRPTASTPMPA